MQTKNTLIRRELLELAKKRGSGKTFCPSEVARNIQQDDWQVLMESIRREGKKMVNDNLLICTQKGKPADPILAKGPIRFGLYPKNKGKSQ